MGSLTGPDVRVVLQMLQQSLDGGDTLRVASTRRLPNNTLLIVCLEPRCCGSYSLGADGTGHTLLVGTRSISVEVLVHFVDNLVGRVLEVDEGVGVTTGDLNRRK